MPHQKSMLAKRIPVILLALALAVVFLAATGYRFLFPVLPKVSPPKEVVRLDQGWTPDQREKYYQTAQGSLIIPYSWFIALERPELGNHEAFASDENLARYDLVLDSSKFCRLPKRPNNNAKRRYERWGKSRVEAISTRKPSWMQKSCPRSTIY